MTDTPVPDVRELAITAVRRANGDLLAGLSTGVLGYLADAVLAAVEPVIRRQAVPQLDHLGRDVHQAWTEHTDFINDILLNTPESWDGEESAEWIVVEYVRELERRVVALGGSLERWPDEEEGTDHE